ncbi:MAG: universal stress protein [Alphaproteobacteria bacterium]|nr:universal stress protein [Alphaproteobacteria bacterium]
MPKLIALLDGSIYAESVCAHAAWVAGRTGAAVELLHVIGRREAEGAAPADLSGAIKLGARSALLAELSALDEQRAKLLQQRGRAILDDGKAALERAGVAAVAPRLRIGDLIDAVCESETDAEMLIVGKRGEAADFATGHLGSNLERIARSVHKPLLVAARAFRPIETVLVAYDGGPSSRKAVAFMAESPLFAGLTHRIVTVGAEGPQTHARLEEAAGPLRAAGRAVETERLDGQPEAAIARRVEAGGGELLVMGAYGHSRIRNLIIGSTTAAMLQSCRIPVLLFR